MMYTASYWQWKHGAQDNLGRYSLLCMETCSCPMGGCGLANRAEHTSNFGTIYCMSAKTLQHNLWKDMRIRVTEQEAQAFLDMFFATYPGVHRYIENTQKFVHAYHFTYTFTGRRRRFPIISYFSSMANRVGRQAVNARIQTTSSDLVSANLVDVHRAVKTMGGRVALTVHDSIRFFLPKGVAGAVKEMLDELIISRTAERNPWLPVKWAYDCGWGPSYGETKNHIH